MSMLDDGRHLTHERLSTPEATRHEAALHVCSRATDVDDAEQLLEALGLIPYTTQEGMR